MKKFYLIAIMAALTMTASAQQKLNISTYSGTDLARYDGVECNVSMNRYLFNGWNTIALPFDMTESELNETFGSDCQLEKLVAVDNEGASVKLYFQDCKAGGIQANTPYILHYNGENANKNISKLAVVTNDEAAITLTTESGETVTMACAKKHIDGIGFYGVLAADNSEAQFVAVDESKSGFYASRCYIKLASGNDVKLSTIHIGAGEVASIAAIAASAEKVDVYNVSGMRVAKGIQASELNKLQPGIYVVNGQKVLVK